MRNLTPHPHHMVPTLHQARAAARLPGRPGPETPQSAATSLQHHLPCGRARRQAAAPPPAAVAPALAPLRLRRSDREGRRGRRGRPSVPIPAAHSAVDVGRLSHSPLLSGTRRPWNLATSHPRPRHDGAVKVRAARRRAPRASEDSNARGRLFGGGPSPSVRAGLRSPFFFYLDAASRTLLCAQDVERCRRWKQRQKKARRRNCICSLLRLTPRLGHRSHERIVATLERTLGKLVEVGLGSVVLGRNLVLLACFLGLVAVH